MRRQFPLKAAIADSHYHSAQVIVVRDAFVTRSDACDLIERTHRFRLLAF